MYFDPSARVWDLDMESTATSCPRPGVSNGHIVGPHVSIPWDYGTQIQLKTMVKSPNYFYGYPRDYRPDVGVIKVCIQAFDGNQANDLSVASLGIPVAPAQPHKETSLRHSTSKASSTHNSCGVDHTPLRTTPPNVGVVGDPSMAQIPLRISPPMVGSTIDQVVIVQVVLQAMGNPSLGHAVNLSAQPNSGSPQFGSMKPNPRCCLANPHSTHHIPSTININTILNLRELHLPL
ncbi:hypothetical protein AMTR_s00073p00161500 [Amborella trichopoda]|uniref:Uncharacterized protein n=1 Tax=Amborella trichopoda TaxID=13333 RepID=W1NNI8_AMBTC|nr:hypothetical protein AMTR_s00073p00161500 [Amborella trichopoda]